MTYTIEEAAFDEGIRVGRRGPVRAFVAVALVIAAAACGDPGTPGGSPSATTTPSITAPSPTTQPSPTDEADPGRPVSFSTPDGVRIEGRVFGDGRVGVVLGHQIDGDQRDWWSFAPLLADEGYLALTINLRGYCPRDGAGCSGDGSTGDAWRDLAASAGWLRDRGARRVVLVGASMGGTAAVVAATSPDAGVDGMIAVSAPAECCGLAPDPAALGEAGIPMLFIAGRFDGEAPTSARQLARWAGANAEILILSSGEHGVDLVGGLATPQVQRRTTEAILAFLDRAARS